MLPIPHLIKDHWGLKLLALLFATATWMVSTGRDFTSIERVPVIMKLEPPQDGVLLMADGEVGKKEVVFEVNLHGPRLKIEQFMGKTLIINHQFDNVRVEEIRDGESREEMVTLDEKKLEHVLPRDVRVTVITPDTRVVKIDRLIGRRMQVEASLVYTAEEDGSRKPVEKDGDGCLDGFRITGFVPLPRHVTVLGPQSVLHNRERVQAQPALVERLNRDTDRRVSIVPFIETEEYGRVPIICDQEVTVSISVAEYLVEGMLENVPVRLLRPLRFLHAIDIREIDGRTFDPDNPVISIPIVGPEQRVQQIQSNHPRVRVMLDVSDMERIPGPYERPLTIFLPDRIRIDENRMSAQPVVKFEVRPTIITD